MSNAGEKRQIILETASKLFSRYGFNKTSLDEIAAKAQIAKGTVYYYYANKEELFMAAVEKKAEDYFLALQEQLDEIESFEAKLHAFLHIPIRFVYENMPILIECMRNLPYNYQDRLNGFRLGNRSRMMEMLKGILKLGEEQGILADNISGERLSDMLVDWYLMGDMSFTVIDVPKLLQRIERDHELIIQMILYGIVKRG
ncbi:TetR/AcrR family transcriptional regulator [Candidatus Cloacimonadaceae bacterium]